MRAFLRKVWRYLKLIALVVVQFVAGAFTMFASYALAKSWGTAWQPALAMIAVVVVAEVVFHSLLRSETYDDTKWGAAAFIKGPWFPHPQIELAAAAAGAIVMLVFLLFYV